MALPETGLVPWAMANDHQDAGDGVLPSGEYSLAYGRHKIRLGPTVLLPRDITSIVSLLKQSGQIPEFWDSPDDYSYIAVYLRKTLRISFGFNRDRRVLTIARLPDYSSRFIELKHTIHFLHDPLGTDFPRVLRPFPEELRDAVGYLAALPDQYWPEVSKGGLMIGSFTAVKNGVFFGQIPVFYSRLSVTNGDYYYPDTMDMMDLGLLTKDQRQNLLPVALLVDRRGGIK